MVKNASGRDGYRSFTIVNVGKQGGCKTKFHGGKYVSKTPVQAARKAFTELCRVKRIRGVCTLVVSVQETTSGSSKKVFSYKLNRLKLKQPMIMQEGTDNEYVIEYETKVKALKGVVPTECKKKGQSRGRMRKRTARKRSSRKTPNNVRRLRKRLTRMLGM